MTGRRAIQLIFALMIMFGVHEAKAQQNFSWPMSAPNGGGVIGAVVGTYTTGSYTCGVNNNVHYTVTVYTVGGFNLNGSSGGTTYNGGGAFGQGVTLDLVQGASGPNCPTSGSFPSYVNATISSSVVYINNVQENYNGDQVKVYINAALFP